MNAAGVKNGHAVLLPNMQPTGDKKARAWSTAFVHLLRKPTLILSGLIIGVVLLWAFVPDVFSPYDPIRADVSKILLPPSTAHFFGTDELGRDVFSRVVEGTAVSLIAPLIAVAIGLVFGGLIGLLAGFLGPVVDGFLMRVVDVVLAIPMLVLAMTVVTAVGFGAMPLAIGVGIAMVGSVARVMRSEVLRIRQLTFVDAERSMGAPAAYIVFRHVLPSSMGSVLVLAVLDFVQAILAIAALSFLGFGAPPPTPEWGSVVSAGEPYLTTGWWIATLPGLTIAVFAVAVNRIARELQKNRGIR
ncbi:ABC transporter permease [Arthrobacter sp. efr-133-TYG-120]|uniref:ABC transporter permease n=1 Tax=Arthrobacter sp. efr-133-TYG-120 TaxID=3040280 RepID=UPI00254C0285|nr:ABC transporter permease [Arthrobacter sp. efr-133-TYG-120]